MTSGSRRDAREPPSSVFAGHTRPATRFPSSVPPQLQAAVCMLIMLILQDPQGETSPSRLPSSAVRPRGRSDGRQIMAGVQAVAGRTAESLPGRHQGRNNPTELVASCPAAPAAASRWVRWDRQARQNLIWRRFQHLLSQQHPEEPSRALNAGLFSSPVAAGRPCSNSMWGPGAAAGHCCVADA